MLGDFQTLTHFRLFRIGAVTVFAVLFSNGNTYAQQVPSSIASSIQSLAQDRVDLNRCVNHPQFGKEVGSGSRLGIDSQSLSDQLDGLANDMQYSEKGRLMYLSYANSLRQFETIAKANPQLKARTDATDINLVCDSNLLNPIKQRVTASEKRIHPYLK